MKLRILSLSLLGLAATVSASSAFGQELLREHVGDSYWVSNSNGTGFIGDELGRLFALEDLNADGVEDYALFGWSGRASTGFYIVQDGASGHALSPRHHGVPPRRPYGANVVRVGDFNGDGIEDYGRRGPGRAAYIVDVLTDAEIAHLSFPSQFSGQGYGSSIVALGDINGDGFDDVAVGAEERDKVGIHLGPDGSIATTLTTLGGGSLATVGDIDGDGVTDLLVADGPFDRITAVSCATFQPIYTVLGGGQNPYNDYFGFSIAAMSDINGDSFPDFVVGAPGTNQISTQRRGYIEFHSGRDGSFIRRVHGPVAREDPYFPGQGNPPRDLGSFGYRVDSGGDTNGDGVDDVMVSSPSRYRLDFPQRGADTLVSGATGAFLADLELWDRDDPRTGPNGLWSTILGDLDGDGLAEFSVGSATDETGGENAGKVWIFRGFRADALPACEPPPHSGGMRARLTTDGSLALSVQKMWLRILDAPRQTTAVVFTSPGVTTTPHGPFGLCIGGPGTIRLSGALAADADGVAEVEVQLGSPPIATAWMPGTTWTVQGAFRDPPGTLGVGTTNALVIEWGP